MSNRHLGWRSPPSTHTSAPHRQAGYHHHTASTRCRNTHYPHRACSLRTPTHPRLAHSNACSGASGQRMDDAHELVDCVGIEHNARLWIFRPHCLAPDVCSRGSHGFGEARLDSGFAQRYVPDNCLRRCDSDSAQALQSSVVCRWDTYLISSSHGRLL